MTEYDAVLNYDLVPVFNGTPKATKSWLKEKRIPENTMEYRIYISEQDIIVTVWEYLYMYT